MCVLISIKHISIHTSNDKKKYVEKKKAKVACEMGLKMEAEMIAFKNKKELVKMLRRCGSLVSKSDKFLFPFFFRFHSLFLCAFCGSENGGRGRVLLPLPSLAFSLKFNGE
jgi:hypothetical protein